MTAPIRSKGFQDLPPDIKQMVAQFLPPNSLATSSAVAPVFQKLMEDPKLWKQVAEKLKFKVDPKNPKQDFINLAPINNRILDHLTIATAEPIRKLNPFAQRAAIEKCISEIDFGKDSYDAFDDKNELLKLMEELSEQIRQNPAESNLEKAALIFLYRNGVLKYGGSVHFEELRDAVNKDFEIFTAYLEGMKIRGYTGILMEDILRWAIGQEDPKFVKSVMEAGAVPPFNCVADAIVKIAFAKGKEAREKMEAAMAPIFNAFKSYFKMISIIQQAQKLADEMVANGKEPGEVWSPVESFMSTSWRNRKK